jgi:hypothetical protein
VIHDVFGFVHGAEIPTGGAGGVVFGATFRLMFGEFPHTGRLCTPARHNALQVELYYLGRRWLPITATPCGCGVLRSANLDGTCEVRRSPQVCQLCND